ncbi:hypothetical protein Ddc_13125 [Ditylenchus destructor]|nr:hypothetical protein Ddc_13125 [Ditylenchus destructor]
MTAKQWTQPPARKMQIRKMKSRNSGFPTVTTHASPGFVSKTRGLRPLEALFFLVLGFVVVPGFVSETRGLRPLEALFFWCLDLWLCLALSVRLAAFGRSKPYFFWCLDLWLCLALSIMSYASPLGSGRVISQNDFQTMDPTSCPENANPENEIPEFGISHGHNSRIATPFGTSEVPIDSPG